MRIKAFVIVAAALVLFAGGCATRQPGAVVKNGQEACPCADFLRDLDDAVRENGVEDAGSLPVAGLPYLKTNRFLSALKDHLKTREQKRLWISWLQATDQAARMREIHNLPVSVLFQMASRWNIAPSRAALSQRMRRCSATLRQQNSLNLSSADIAQAVHRPPDEYATLLRIFGLYPLTVLPVSVLTYKARREFQSWYRIDLAHLPVLGQLVTYAPPETDTLRPADLRALFRTYDRRMAGVPRLSTTQIATLAHALAPVLMQDVASDDDRPGSMRWQGKRLDVDPQIPTVYFYASHAFCNAQPILQINYVIWYGARWGTDAPWIERGPLDGLTLRISLTPEGEPFMVDGINNCGCYHFFAPRKASVGRKISQLLKPDAFVPQWMPAAFPDRRIAIRVSSGWHQVQRLIVAPSIATNRTYRLLPYRILEMLPKGHQRWESMFDNQDIAKHRERIEAAVLFPMGIPKVGSMRQRGHHAIVFEGRAHFDDPYLFDRHFVFKFK